MNVIVTQGSIDYQQKSYLPGETITNISEKEAVRLIGKGKVKPEDPETTVQSADDQLRQTLNKTMSVPKLKEELGKIGVEIPPGSQKADLIELFIANTAEPPAQE